MRNYSKKHRKVSTLFSICKLARIAFLYILPLIMLTLSLPKTFYTQTQRAFQVFSTDTEGNMLAGSTAGIFRSTNGGNSFYMYGLDTLDIDGIAVAKNGHIFVATYTDFGLFRSTNNGVAWHQIGLANQYAINDVTIDSAGGILAASHSNYIWRSTNDGDSWVRVNISGLPSYRCYALGVSPNSDVFAAMDGGISRSSNNGLDWVTIHPSGITYCITITGAGDIFAGRLANQGIVRSTNNGNNWIRADSGITNKFISSITSHPNGKIYAATLGGGVFVSTNNGEFWTYAGLDSSRVYSLYVNPIGNLFAGVEDGIFRYTDIGTTWLRIFPGQASIGDHRVQHSDVHLSISNNYPNPFNSSTFFEFTTSRTDQVTITLFDGIGQSLYTLFDGLAIREKTHRIEFEASHLSSGIYFLRVNLRDQTMTRKVILSK